MSSELPLRDDEMKRIDRLVTMGLSVPEIALRLWRSDRMILAYLDQKGRTRDGN